MNAGGGGKGRRTVGMVPFRGPFTPPSTTTRTTEPVVASHEMPSHALKEAARGTHQSHRWTGLFDPNLSIPLQPKRTRAAGAPYSP